MTPQMFDTSLKKKRVVGLVLLAVLLALFLVFNRIPKLDTVRADLAIATSSEQECFQGFCIESPEESTLLSRWWNFSVTYLRLVAMGMTFAFLVAGATEAFLFPQGSSRSFSTGGVAGSLKGLLVGPVMNLCSACIVPVSAAFRRRGASIESTLAIVQGSSTLNLPAMIMAAMVFVPMIGGARIALSVVGALLIGPLVAAFAGERGRRALGVQIATDPEEQRDVSWSDALKEGFREWLRASVTYLVRLGPIMVLAGFASALAIQWVSPDVVSTYLGNDLVGVGIAATLGLLINVPLLFEIPLVAALLLVGMGTAPAATLLFAAASGGPITFWGLAKFIPRRGIVVYGTAIWVVAVGGGVAVMGLNQIVPSDNTIGLNASVMPVAATDIPQLDGTVRVGRGSSAGDFPVLKTAATRAVPPTQRADTSTSASNGATLSGTEPVMPFTNIALASLRNDNEWVDEVANYRPGVVVFDYDADGDTDFYITAEAGAPNFLYQNDGNGVYTDVATAAGVAATTRNSSGAVACDLNNDGHRDLYVGSRGIAAMGPGKHKGDGLDFRSALGNDEASRQLREAITDRLFLNNGDGSFTDVTESAVGDAVNLRSAGSIACADVDGDGWLDLYVGNMIDEDFFQFKDRSHPGHYNLMYINNGDLTFNEIGAAAGVRGDQIKLLDTDGEPVVFSDPSTGLEYVGFDPSIMDDNGNMVGDPTGRTHGVLFFDYDDDRDPDLFVADDGDTFKIYRNDSADGSVRFAPVSTDMEIDIVGNWMGFAVGDYDGDADIDVFVTNQGYHLRQYPPQEEVGGDCRYNERFDWGTCLHFLLQNPGPTNGNLASSPLHFAEVAGSTEVRPSPIMPPASLDPENIHSNWDVPTGLAAYDFGYGTTFFDFDNDGHQDLYWLGSEPARGEGPGGEILKSAGRMLRGDGRGGFEDITVRAHLLDIMDVDYSLLDPNDSRFDSEAQRIDGAYHENGKGLAHGDINGDGYVDLIGTNSSGPIWTVPGVPGDTAIPASGTVFVWLNGGGDNHWITLKLKGRMGLDGTGSNADGIGARVYVKTGPSGQRESLIQVQEVRAGSSYLSMDSIDLEFGLGQATVVDQITVHWPSGRDQTLQNIPVDQVLKIVEPTE